MTDSVTAAKQNEDLHHSQKGHQFLATSHLSTEEKGQVLHRLSKYQRLHI